MVKLVNRLYEETKITNLCFAGGVALNCTANSRILNETQIKSIFIPPFANDKGQAIGNALLGYYNFFNKTKKIAFRNDYLGKKYSNLGIMNSILRKPEMNIMKINKYYDFEFKLEKGITKAAAKLIAEGNIIGWFQGRSEYGPRALGNRCILADPRKEGIKNRLNKIKQRESFRPYSPSILYEYVNDFFHIDFESPFMLFSVRAKDGKRNDIPAVVHIDGTARIQTVKRKNNKKFHDLIEEFRKISGIPLLLNTSFNLGGEPIVETTADAIGCFLRSELDFLVIEDYLIKRKDF